MAKIACPSPAQGFARYPQETGAATVPLEHRSTRTELELHAITPPAAADACPLDPMRVLGLAQSIAAVGLLEPVVVDQRGRVVCGGHRLAALRLLHERVPTQRAAMLAALLAAVGTPASAAVLISASNLLPAVPGYEPHPMRTVHPSWPRVAVRMIAVDAERQPEAALAAAAATNAERRAYSRDEIRALAQRLASAGFVRPRGRHRAGAKLLVPALAAIVGCPARTILAALSDDAAASAMTANAASLDATAALAVARLSDDLAAAKVALMGGQSAGAKRLAGALDELATAIAAFQATQHP